MRIRSLIFVTAALVFVPGLVASLVAVHRIKEAALDASLGELREFVRSTALLIDAEARQSAGAMKALAQSDALVREDWRAFYDQATAINQAPDVWTLLLDGNGRQILNTSAPYGTPPPPAAARDRVRRALDTGTMHVSDLFTGAVSGKRVTTMYFPVRLKDGREYAIAQAFAVGHWERTVMKQAIRPGWTVAVMDRTGRFVARNLRAEALVGQPARPELHAAASRASEGLIRHQTLEGTEAYDAFAHSRVTGWTIAVAAPVVTVEAAASQAGLWLAFGIALVLGAATGAALYLGRKFLEAVESAGQAARAIATGAAYAAPSRSSVREVRSLHAALQEAGALVRAERASREAAEQERERLLKAEGDLRAQAEVENAAKDRFIAQLGHELRTPLAAVAAASQVLQRTPLDAVGRRFVEVVLRQVRHLARMVDDLLDVSRMLNDRIQLSVAVLDLGTCVQRSVDDTARTDVGSSHRITCHVAPGTWILGDAVRIEQIVTNLVTNAVKFSPAGSRVDVTVRHEGTHCVLDVADEGGGIPESVKDTLFHPFVQGPALPGNRGGGLGLGLALVDQLVRLHDGTVAVTPNRPAGTTFSVRFPAAAAAGDSTAGGDVPGAGSGVRILLVEDDLDAREAMMALLGSMGHEVTGAEDGDAALAALEKWGFDIVLMDIGLPGMDGHEVAGRIRQRHGARLPLVALTGFGQAGDRERTRRSGFDAHLVKPADPDQLEGVVTRLTGRGGPGQGG